MVPEIGAVSAGGSSVGGGGVLKVEKNGVSVAAVIWHVSDCNVEVPLVL